MLYPRHLRVNVIPVRLSTERTPCYMLIEALRNKLI